MSKLTQTEAIKNFLDEYALPYLAERYDPYMEVQVEAAPDGGQRTTGEHKDRKWWGWTDGNTTWKSFRIPHNSMTEPVYEEKPITWELTQHCNGIGLTGWAFGPDEPHSRWVGFDFDSIVGHSENHTSKLPPAEISRIERLVEDLPYVECRYSTGGNGRHLIVHLDPYIPTENHNVHAALARSILIKMGQDVGYDFVTKVDAMGHVLWHWHRKLTDSGGKGLMLIKSAEPLREVPKDWREHVEVIQRRLLSRPIYLPASDEENPKVEAMKEVIEQDMMTSPSIPYDEDHVRLIRYLEQIPEWITYHKQDKGYNYIHTHTKALEAAHKALGLKGLFTTTSTGSSRSNCWMYALPKGGWKVTRFGYGVQEHDSWQRTSQGKTFCYYNTDPTVRSASSFFNGVENAKKGFDFMKASEVMASLQAMGITPPDLPDLAQARKATLSELSEGRIEVQIDCKGVSDAVQMPGWSEKGGKWIRIFRRTVERDIEIHTATNDYDNVLRLLRNQSKQVVGWSYFTSQTSDWTWMSKEDIKYGLKARGMESKDVDDAYGACVNAPWDLVNIPFAPEYPGGRTWNHMAAQLAYPVKESNENLHYPTWMRILNHVGQGLTRAVGEDEWCRDNGILTGGDYLKIWCAWMFQQPNVRLPYLFFYSLKQMTGKSTFHEALAKLFLENRGYVKAEKCITTQFNGSLRNAVLCVLEEMDLSKDKQAYNTIKDLVTAANISINEKNEKLDLVANTTHWIQAGNRLTYLPIEPDDTRIVVVHVDEIRKEDFIRPRDLDARLRKEASDFLTELFMLELPETPNNRMAIPILRTEEKTRAEQSKESVLDTFLREQCFPVNGSTITAAALYDIFIKSLDPQDRTAWPRKRFIQNVPQEMYPYGRRKTDSQWCFGNISMTDEEPRGPKLISVGGGDKARLLEDPTR
jgi:hypothetical protein